MNLSSYLIGERINTGGRGVNPRYHQAYQNPKMYWRYAMSGALGGFCWYNTPAGKRSEADCWKKMRSIIGELQVSEFNMLVPSAIVGSWSMNEAHRAADCVIARCERPALLICCGTRVAKAIHGAGEEGEYPQTLGRVEQIGEQLWMTRIPHPSGRNNGLWYNPEVIKRAKTEFEVGLGSIALQSGLVT